MKRGLRQALVWLVGTALFALVAAGIWSALTGDDFRVAFAVALMAIGALLAFTGSNAISRAGSMDAFAFLGMGPESDDPDSGEGLTGLGIFLFVSLPLVVAGGLLYGTG
jgi:hypothetical protein